MGGLRSWAGSLLSLITFFIVRSVTRGLAAPMFVAVIAACIYIWILVLRVPEMKDIKPDEDSMVSPPVAPAARAPAAAETTSADAADPPIAAPVELSAHEAAEKLQPADDSGTATNSSSLSATCQSKNTSGADASPKESEVSSTPEPIASGSAACSAVPSDTTADVLPQPAATEQSDTTADVLPQPAATEQTEVSASAEEECTARDAEKRDACEGDDAAGDAEDKEADEAEEEEEEEVEDKEEDGCAADGKDAEDSDVSTDEEERRRREQEEEDEHTDPDRAQQLRLEGNEFFKAGKLHDAREAYSEALYLTPSADKKEKSVLFSNRSACHLKLSRWEDVVSDCKQAIELDESYAKAYNRRSIAYENLGKWHDANEDLKKAIELDPSLRSKEYKRQAMLEQRAQEQLEKDKEEMMGKLKDLGNMVLGKFGMSVDNFKCEKDPGTGSYSIKFQN